MNTNAAEILLLFLFEFEVLLHSHNVSLFTNQQEKGCFTLNQRKMIMTHHNLTRYNNNNNNNNGNV